MLPSAERITQIMDAARPPHLNRSGLAFDPRLHAIEQAATELFSLRYLKAPGDPANAQRLAEVPPGELAGRDWFLAENIANQPAPQPTVLFERIHTDYEMHMAALPIASAVG